MSPYRRPMAKAACSTGQALVLASWEKNKPAWREGGFYELRSHKPRLQEAVGAGGDLWIVVSRPTKAGRLYTVSFRLRSCHAHDYQRAGDFGRHAVIGDSERSRFFATSDARLLLLALRFEPHKPINGPNDDQISNSIRVPRCLTPPDIKLLEDHAARSDRWGAFISYQRRGDQAAADDVADALQLSGVSVFRDQDTLRGGDKWWPTIKRAISRSRRFIVLVGRSTHESTWVRREVQHALIENVRVIPVFVGGDFEHWTDLQQDLASRHALNLEDGIDKVVDGLILD